MKFEDFESGKYKQQFEYKSFSPVPINHEWTWDDARINSLLEEATTALTQLATFSSFVPEVDRFIRMHVVKEANTSSRIEGTQTEMDEDIVEKEYIADEKRDDWQEVQNYITAMNTAIDELNDLPLSNRLLKQTHARLLEGVRGERKTPGEFRRSQNWIGGATIADATFIPPHQDELPDLLSDLENFWHNEQINVPHLIRIAISHYQFETIHPFLDGNGRIGRLLIALYLLDKGLLTKPSLYLSAHLAKHKGLYYDSLTAVRESNDLGQWIRFFLVAVRDTAKKGVQTFQNIMEMRDEMQARIQVLGKRMHNGIKLLEELYGSPILTGPQIAERLGISQPTANILIKEFVEMEILHEITGYRRNRQYFFRDYFSLFMD
ncbi:Fic family protein [Pseudodesulfovibrio sediminis]|uniref:Toxin Fic n=1 Tax=Pseudodesulfovibrio sediminis TaxID=2810563 RepID=A0ABM7P8V5_9BACT|nr:Fic family protein [Pseudodesulfovibrio sediminis]BCS89466.1 toxin Fic [Pseudodesulfovibrio sediminis]